MGIVSNPGGRYPYLQSVIVSGCSTMVARTDLRTEGLKDIGEHDAMTLTIEGCILRVP